MKRLYFISLLFFAFSFQAFAQTQISGVIKDDKGEPLTGVNIVIKGRVIGTITDINGKFNLSVNDNPPMTMVISFIGFRSQEIQITQPVTSGIDISMEEETLLGQEVVVSASRVEESIMESPVSIEKMDILAVQNTPADNYYKGIANLKGVDIATSSINFQIINTRGFASTGNTRFVQLTDGMDTQAPALNFPIGNLNGPSELDVESVELIPGASSAIYGPNAFNGILLVNSKNAFEYQGLSAFAKTGVNHVGKKADDSPSPLWEGAIRYAKSFNNKFAFKINAAYMQANDWNGTDATDREAARTPAGFSFNPGSDRLHYMGDEASINLAIFPLSTSWRTFASAARENIYGPGLSALSYADAGDLPSQVVSITPYKEKDLISYDARNIKANVGLYYRLNDKAELSYLYNGGFGTSIYTGAQRYSLKNFGIQQHRLQLRGDNYYVRGYTTIEDSGDSYITEFLAKRINDLAIKASNPLFSDVSGYLATYGTEYIRYLNQEANLNPGEMSTLPADQQLAIQQAAHAYARNRVDNGFTVGSVTRPGMILDPNSSQFADLKAQANSGTIPDGPKFSDATRLYHVEGQYDFKNEIDFMELQAGGSFRQFDLRSGGTIFDDGVNPIRINEYGAYIAGGKWLGDRKFKLSGSVRYDKNENFKGRINPRISGLLKLKQNHNLRLSYQTGFRIPTTQGQFIDLSILTARLLGGLEQGVNKYNILRKSTTGQNLAFEGFSVERFSKGVFDGGANPAAIAANASKLEPFMWNPVKTEKVQNIEIGYKGLIENRLLVDLTYYYNIYNDFITQVRVRIADQLADGTPDYRTLLNGTALTKGSDGTITGNTAQLYTNFTERVTSQGAVAGLTYSLPKGYTVGANYNWNVLVKEPDPNKFLVEFNTPEHKVNFSFGNRKVTENLGFSVNWRWQTAFEWQSSFTIPANGEVPTYSTIDAQLSYKLVSTKSILKLGGSNLLNNKYIQSLGGPNIGALYYLSITFDDLLN